MGFSVGSSEGSKYGKLDGCNHFWLFEYDVILIYLNMENVRD